MASLTKKGLSFFGEVDGVAATIFWIGAALDESAAFEGVEQTDEIGLFNAQGLADVPLAPAGIRGDQNQSGELRGTKLEWAHETVKALCSGKARREKSESNAGGERADVEFGERCILFAPARMLCGFFLCHLGSEL